MITENLSTLKIHKLTKAQYERELAAGNIDPNALYLTPDEDSEAISDIHNVVKYDVIQDLEEHEGALARLNIDAANIEDIYENYLEKYFYEWDGATTGRDSFTINSSGMVDVETGAPIPVDYYKVSDNVLDRSLAVNCNYVIISDNNGRYVYDNGHTLVNGICSGIVCEKEKYYFTQSASADYSQIDLQCSAIFVEEAGQYVYEDETFNVPSAGVYFPYYKDSFYIRELVFVTSDKTGIFLNSNTKVGDTENKKFIVRVDSDGALKTVDKNNTTVKMATESDLVSKITSPTSAEVGQILSVKSVDSNGNITWETIDNVSDTVEVDSGLSKEGFAADAKVTGDAISNLNTLVGDTAVSEQIETAISEAIVEVYTQNDEPVNAPEGSLWIDTSKDGLPNTQSSAARVYVADVATTDITTVDFSKYAIGDVVLVTSS